jgi:hypothetical protein
MKKILIALVLIILAVIAYNAMTQVAEEAAPLPTENPAGTELPAQAGLPEAVEARRQAIYQAAISRDYDRLASEASEEFNYSFGGEYEGGFAGYLRLAEENERLSAFDIIPTILRLPYAEKDGLYTWPSVFTIEPSKWTEEDIALMRTFLSEEQIEDFREFGGYIYYRMGIDSTGNWKFYLAGD